MANHYSPSEFIKTAYSLVMTKLTFPQARLIRRPIYIRGASSIKGAEGLTTGRFCRFDLAGEKKTLFVGKRCEFGDMTHIVAHNHIEIGDNVLIASKCFISDTNHGCYKGEEQDSPFIPPNSRKLTSGFVVIGNNVWIGENAVLLAGSEIGDGCIVGANAIINKKIPAGSMVVGNNKIIKTWDDRQHTWKLKKHIENIAKEIDNNENITPS